MFFGKKQLLQVRIHSDNGANRTVLVRMNYSAHPYALPLWGWHSKSLLAILSDLQNQWMYKQQTPHGGVCCLLLLDVVFE